MPGLNVASLKYTWRGAWTSGQKYLRNDLVQWNNSTYVCINDMGDEFEFVMDTSVQTSTFRLATPEIHRVDKRPDNLAYWKLVLRGNSFRRGWAPHKVYQLGDVVRYGGDLYMYINAPGYGATATANISNGSVVSVTVNNGGSFYVNPPTVSFATKSFPNMLGIGAQAIANVGTSTVTVSTATQANPVRVTTSSAHTLTNGQNVSFRDIPGMTQLNNNSYFVSVINSTQIDLYTDANLVSTVDGTLFKAYYSGGSGTLIKTGVVSSIVVTNGGSGYTVAPEVIINPSLVRNTWVEDTVYWCKVFENPNPDTRRMYAVATANMQPLGWTRNNGDAPSPQTHEGNQIAMIDALGACYTIGGSGNSNTYNTAGRGIKGWASTWQPAGFTFVDWLRSTDNVTSLQLTGVLNTVGLPTPDGQHPKCIQWVKTLNQSYWVFNNGEVYFSGYSVNGESGDSSNTTKNWPVRVYSASTVGYLGETLPRSFIQTKIVKLDCPCVGSSSSSTTSVYALGNDGSVWVWGNNSYGQLGLGQQTPGTVDTTTTGGYAANQFAPVRIPAQFFDYKKIVDIMSFGNEVTSVLALDEDGGLWGWGADYHGELGMGGSQGRDNRRPIPTKVPFDFAKYGGVKKMSYIHYSTTDIRTAFILTHDGSLFGAGYFQNQTSPLLQLRDLNAAVTRWTRYINTNANCKSIENFWVVGDARDWNMYIRERDTGLTFAIGGNWTYTLGQQANSNFWWNSGGIQGAFSLVKGPRNLVHVTNNSAQSSTGASGSGSTVVLLEESGRAWGMGVNSRGSLSLGFNTAVGESQMQNPETGGGASGSTVPMFQPIKVPGARLTTMMGYGTAASGTTDDLCLYITDDGQALYCGTDGTLQNGTPNLQGNPALRWWQTNIGAPGPGNRYAMHSQMGD